MPSHLPIAPFLRRSHTGLSGTFPATCMKQYALRFALFVFSMYHLLLNTLYIYFMFSVSDSPPWTDF